MLQRLNYHHLVYFHAAVEAGSVTAAARRLRLAQPTLSAQIRQLEAVLGEPLFDRRGPHLDLTPLGRTVHAYADEIVRLGGELIEVVAGAAAHGPRLRVGVADALPKLLVYRLLEPGLGLPGARLEVRDGEVDTLLRELEAHRLDLVLSDAPVPTGRALRAYNHALGECGTTFFAAPALVARLRPPFPACLDGAPLLLPASGTPLRRTLDEWLDRLGLRPVVVGEVADSALLKAFGQAGAGIFAAPTAVADAVVAQHGVAVVGTADDVVERFWALSGERRIRHPAVAAVVGGAANVFGATP